jgi:23S rRNA (uracil1939-C5)-methyltransferase
VPVEKCAIQSEKTDAIIATIRRLAVSFKYSIYDEDKRTGLLRHVLIRTGYHTKEIMIVLVLSSPVMPGKNNFVKALLKEHPDITTILINVNDKKTSMVLDKREQVIYGKGYINDVLCGLTYRISAKSFFQVNPKQTEVLYKKAIEFCEFTGKENVIDAYCGTGTIGLTAAAGVAGAKGAASVTGIELNKAAVVDANNNKKANNIKNIHFINADATEELVKMAYRQQKADVIIMDPPRAGSTPEFIKAAAQMSPERICYISCEPVTLARDLAVFKKKGYYLKKCCTVDMFPWTAGIETVCLLSKG